MKNLMKIIVAYLVFIPVLMAEGLTLSGAVGSVDLRHNTIVINNRPYTINSNVRINDRQQLIRGSIIDFTMDSNNFINKIEVRPGLHIVLPPLNN